MAQTVKRYWSIYVCSSIWIGCLLLLYLVLWHAMGLTNLRKLSHDGIRIGGVIDKLNLREHSSIHVVYVVRDRSYGIWGTTSRATAPVRIGGRQQLVYLDENPAISYLGDPEMTFRDDIKMISALAFLFATLAATGSYKLLTAGRVIRLPLTLPT